jgi:hypothetical protein
MGDIPNPMLVQLAEAVQQIAPLSHRIPPSSLRKASPDDIDKAIGTLIKQAAISMAGAILLDIEKSKLATPVG